MMAVVPNLFQRPDGQSVEDVLALLSEEAATNRERLTQLAAIRYYIQAIIANCETGWYRNEPVPMNMMALIDHMENFRRDGPRPFFVTFNYDRIIETSLEIRGQEFDNLGYYVRDDAYQVFKLHGSVDWLRRIPGVPIAGMGGSGWEVAHTVATRISQLPPPGEIAKSSAMPATGYDGVVAIPAIAIPLKTKTTFECPEEHLGVLTRRLGEVRAILTVGWRGAERHFLELLMQYNRSAFQIYCVSGSDTDAEETMANMRRTGIEGHFKLFGGGFSSFIAEHSADPLFRTVWPPI